MIQGLYAAASGMMAIEDQQAIIANNIANASTPGFKRQNVIEEGFYQVFSDQMRDPAVFSGNKAPGGGVRVAGSYADWRPGTLASTGDPFNLALSGPGFFTVQTEDGDRYTRGGRFQVDPDGHLATAEGHKVMGVGGVPIDVRGGRLEVDDQGNIFAGGSNVGRLMLAEFSDARTLMREDDGLYAAADPAVQATEAANTQVASGMLEMSNVQMPYEMTQMIAGVRAYGAYQRVISTSDETVGRLIDQVAMPG